MDMELLQKALFNLPRLQAENNSPNRPVEKLCQLNWPSSPEAASAVEAVSPNVVFELASLVLYGSHAVPVRLKILLDRLFSVLNTDDVAQILKGYGWTLEDYQRGYILKDSRGTPLERWQMCSKEEEPLVLQQFLRFGETRPLSQALLLQELSEKSSSEEARARSEIKKILERNAAVAVAAAANNSHHRSSPSPQNLLSPPPSNGAPAQPPLSPHNNKPHVHNNSLPPFDYRNKEGPRKSPSEVPASMRIPPTSMAAAVGLAAVGGLPPMLPNVSLANYHNMAKAQQELSRVNSKPVEAEQHPKESTSSSASSPPIESGKASPEAVNGCRLMSVEIRKKMRDNIGISYVNPATGKKRVQCNVCLKTFCDKGALKIHFSAVHLREMHKCSVEGCNMMFSSRRSRNRHSANPNPKLHTPHLRRKISPHDGRTHQGPSILPYHAAAVAMSGGKGSPFPPHGNTFSNLSGLLPPELIQRQTLELQRIQQMNKRIRMAEEGSEDGGGPPPSCSSPTGPSQPHTPTSGLTGHPPSSSSSSGGRKRKSQNPTRLKVSSDGDGEEMFSSDEDDEGFENPMDDIDDDSEEESKGNAPKEGLLKVISDEKLLLLPPGSEEEEDPIPLDAENPTRCLECAKEFESHFLLKAHYTADHLKHLHKCSIEGCNAGFPSKRSRDRHSANHNLHRKLLSTESSFQQEVMSRLYAGELKVPPMLPTAPAPSHPLFFGMPFFGNGPFFRPPLLPPPPNTASLGASSPFNPHAANAGPQGPKGLLNDVSPS